VKGKILSPDSLIEIRKALLHLMTMCISSKICTSLSDVGGLFNEHVCIVMLVQVYAVNGAGLELYGYCGPGVQAGTLVGTILEYRPDIAENEVYMYSLNIVSLVE
jgi:hypothetical protein